MKLILLLPLLLLSFCSSSQVLNPSFENGSGADLSDWQWTCNAQSNNSAPSGCGNWCIKVWSGNTQGCWPGYAYQKIPSITNTQTFYLSGFAFTEVAPYIGIYFAKINSGVITLLAGDTTSSTAWTKLNVQSNFLLASGDTAAIVLYGGSTGGPVQGYGYFDSLNLKPSTAVHTLKHDQAIHILPNPLHEYSTIQTERDFLNGVVTIYNLHGIPVRTINNISGNKFTIKREGLSPGVYFLTLRESLGNIHIVEKLTIE